MGSLNVVIDDREAAPLILEWIGYRIQLLLDLGDLLINFCGFGFYLLLGSLCFGVQSLIFGAFLKFSFRFSGLIPFTPRTRYAKRCATYEEESQFPVY